MIGRYFFKFRRVEEKMLLFILLFMGGGLSVLQGQSLNQLLKNGNKLYKEQHYPDAEADYKKALSRDSSSGIGQFNLGNALYQQKRYENAAQLYDHYLKGEQVNSLERAESQYNIGNTFMAQKKWDKAIESYKKSLLENPKDEEARYNLAYAQAMLEKDKSGKGGQNDQKKDQQDQQQNKDKQDNKDKQNNKDQQQDNQQNKQDQQDQQNKDQQQDQKNQKQQPDEQNQQDQPRNQPQPQPGQMDQQRAEQLLNAAAQQERKIREEKGKKGKGVKAYKGKQW